MALDDFSTLIDHLAGVHPSRYRQLLAGIDAVVWRDVETITEQAVALRFVVLADRLYDKDVPILASGVPFDQLFTRRDDDRRLHEEVLPRRVPPHGAGTRGPEPRTVLAVKRQRCRRRLTAGPAPR